MKQAGESNAQETFRAGDWVEVRSLAEIIQTLDSACELDGLPFMPEMAQCCGRTFRVFKSAHKTCDPTGETNLRRLGEAVHLDARCDGSAHDGCEARCLFYWKTAWLKPRGADGEERMIGARGDALERLHAATRTQAGTALRYRCQATQIVRATTPIAGRELRQYREDLRSGNVPLQLFLRVFAVAIAKAVLSRLRRVLPGAAGSPGKTRSAEPTQRPFDPQPGEMVRIRPAREIVGTLDSEGKHRGLALEREMLRHCGVTRRVIHKVGRIIDERSGRMIELRNDCLVLDGLTCAGLENRGRLFCPRSSYFYWRAAWLQPVRSEGPANRQLSSSPVIPEHARVTLR